MISGNRVYDGSSPIPKLLISKEDIIRFMEEFKGLHAQFADCFYREEPRENFYHVTVSKGSKGLMTYEFMKRRVVLVKDRQPGRTVLLIACKSLGEGTAYSYFISNVCRSTCLKVFVWLSEVRRAIEQCFEEAKLDLGMDHHAGRRSPGRRHHMLICTSAHFLLWYIRIRLGKKHLTTTMISQLRVLISAVLPIKLQYIDTSVAINLSRYF